MLFWLALCLVAVFPVSPILGAGIVGVSVAVLPWTRALAGSGVLVNGKDVAFLAYTLVAVGVTVVQTGSQDVAMAIRLVAYPWAVSLVFQNLWISERRARILLSSVMIVALLVGAVMLFQISPGRFDFSLIRLFTLDRQEGFYFLSDTPSGPNAVAYLAAAGIAAGVGLAKGGRPPPLMFATGGVLLVFLVVSGGRVAWAAVVTMLAAAMFLDGCGRPSLRPRTIAIGLTAVAVVATIGFWTSSRIVAGQAGADFEGRVAGIVNPTEDQSFVARLGYWATAVEMFLDNPTGHGLNAYYARFGRTTHNELLGQLVATGWQGTLIYLALLGVTALLLMRAWRKGLTSAHRSVRSAAVYCGLVLAFAMLTEHVSRAAINGLYMIFWILAGAALAQYQMQRDQETGAQEALAE